MLTLQQKKERKNYIGGSDISIIFNNNNYCSINRLYKLKTGLIEYTDDNISSVAQFGAIIESFIACEFLKEFLKKEENKTITFFSDNDFLDKKYFKKNQTFFSDKYKYFAANIDGLIINEDGSKTIIEIKSKNYYEDIDINNFPLNYLLQVNFYMYVLNARDCIFLILDKSKNSYNEYYLTKDDELIEIIINKANEFWNCVVNKKEPESTVNEDIDIKKIKSNKILKINAEQENLINKIKDLKKQKSIIEKDLKEYDFEIKKIIDDNELIINNNNKTLIKVSDVERETIDNNKLRELIDSNTYNSILKKTTYKKLTYY